MPFVDARRLPPGTALQADVCIAGAGPAGLSLALALARRGTRVLLLESGGFDAGPSVDELDTFENTGAPLGGMRLRDRRFGGTRWYGRIVPMDRIDFEGRPWARSAGWPLQLTDIEPYYPEAARFLGLDRPEALARDRWRGKAAARALGGGGIVPSLHLIARAKDLAARHRRAVETRPELTVVLHATVVGIDADDAGSGVTGLAVAASTGTAAFTARATAFVLACGGLENARVMMWLSEARPGILGASESTLGRCYINHPRAEGVGRLYLDRAHADFVSLYRHLVEHAYPAARCTAQVAAALDERTQREERLLNAAAFFYPASEGRLADLREPFEHLRRSLGRLQVRKGDLARARRLAAELPLLAGAAAARARRRPFRLDHLVMVDQLEQAADDGSRLSLGRDRDSLGCARLRVEWRVGVDTLRTHRRFHERLAARIRDEGIGTLKSALLADPEFVPQYEDNAHPMGATRMSRGPHDGVVNEHGRVHALRNLYVAGSSVFPAGGQANPTLTIVALALRLADHLRAHRPD